jgi:hypothetical protein
MQEKKEIEEIEERRRQELIKIKEKALLEEQRRIEKN